MGVYAWNGTLSKQIAVAVIVERFLKANIVADQPVIWISAKEESFIYYLKTEIAPSKIRYPLLCRLYHKNGWCHSVLGVVAVTDILFTIGIFVSFIWLVPSSPVLLFNLVINHTYKMVEIASLFYHGFYQLNNTFFVTNEITL